MQIFSTGARPSRTPQKPQRQYENNSHDFGKWIGPYITIDITPAELKQLNNQCPLQRGIAFENIVYSRQLANYAERQTLQGPLLIEHNDPNLHMPFDLTLPQYTNRPYGDFKFIILNRTQRIRHRDAYALQQSQTSYNIIDDIPTTITLTRAQQSFPNIELWVGMLLDISQQKLVIRRLKKLNDHPPTFKINNRKIHIPLP